MQILVSMKVVISIEKKISELLKHNLENYVEQNNTFVEMIEICQSYGYWYIDLGNMFLIILHTINIQNFKSLITLH